MKTTRSSFALRDKGTPMPDIVKSTSSAIAFEAPGYRHR